MTGGFAMIDNFREWLSDNLRYILLGLAVLLVIIIGVCIFRLIGGSSNKKKAAGKKTTAVTTSQKDEASTESAGSGSVPSASGSLTQDDSDLLKLAQKYYKAVAAKDSATLATIVDPWNATVQSETFNSDIESYDNISTYSKDGPVDGSSLVYVYCECKLPDINTAVPSLRQLFVTTNDSKDLVISDWSQYQEFVTESNKSDEVQSLIREVNSKCQQLAASDPDLKAYLESQGISTSDEASTESASSASSSSSSGGASSGTATATDGVNVRSEASTNGSVLGTLYPGQEVNVVGSEGDWTHINYTNSSTGGTIDGYVSSQYLDFGGSTASSNTNTSAGTTADAGSADNTAA